LENAILAAAPSVMVLQEQGAKEGVAGFGNDLCVQDGENKFSRYFPTPTIKGNGTEI